MILCRERPPTYRVFESPIGALGMLSITVLGMLPTNKSGRLGAF
jgi:hypothetical protein